MGRYAFFSTGLEYKFVFGSQPSSDIRMFGGVVTTDANDLRQGKHSHRWDYEKDGKEILKILYQYVSDSDVIVPDFTAFEQSIEGTHELKIFLNTHSRTYYDWLSGDFNAFTLGCLIYHQLLYTPTLWVGYEV